MQRTTWVFLILLLVYLLIPELQTDPLNETFQVVQKKSKSPSPIKKGSQFITNPSILLQTQAPDAEKSLEEIIKTDDYCALQKYEQSGVDVDRNPYPEIQKKYFEQSEFRVEYEDYQKAIRGEAGYTSFTRLYQALALSGLLAQSNVLPYPLDFKKARILFHELAMEDPGNAAPLIYELAASKDIPSQFLNPLVEQILETNHFNSYQLDFLRQLYNSDGTDAIGFVTKIGFASSLAAPDWVQIRSHIKKKFISRPELTEKIGWLLVDGGLNAKNSWRDLDWDVLEYSMGRSMIKNRDQVPNYVELEKKITGRDTFLMDFKLFDEIAISCTESKVEQIREYAAKLRREGHGLAAF